MNLVCRLLAVLTAFAGGAVIASALLQTSLRVPAFALAGVVVAGIFGALIGGYIWCRRNGIDYRQVLDHVDQFVIRALNKYLGRLEKDLGKRIRLG